MGYLLPVFRRCTAQCVHLVLMLGDVAPTAAFALRAQQPLKPLIAENEHRVRV